MPKEGLPTLLTWTMQGQLEEGLEEGFFIYSSTSLPLRLVCNLGGLLLCFLHVDQWKNK